MKKLIMVLAVLLIGLGLTIQTDVQPASAHNQDFYTAAYCTAHRGPYQGAIVHSKINGLNAWFVGVYCREDFLGHEWEYEVFVPINDWGSGTSYDPSPHRDCE